MRMKTTMTMTKAAEISIAVIICCIILVIVGWFIINGKSLSYSIFYEDMVTETIKDIVKESSLK